MEEGDIFKYLRIRIFSLKYLFKSYLRMDFTHKRQRAKKEGAAGTGSLLSVRLQGTQPALEQKDGGPQREIAQNKTAVA